MVVRSKCLTHGMIQVANYNFTVIKQMAHAFFRQNMTISLPPIVQACLSRPLSLALLPVLLAVYSLSSRADRSRKVGKVGERVLVLGASSGIGQSIAKQYAERGARVCIVGRREARVKEVQVECRDARSLSGFDVAENDILSVSADFTSIDDMVRVRDLLDQSKQATSSLSSL